MPERFLIWGAGGHGRVVRDVLLACGDEVAGFIDRSPNPVLPIVSESSVDDERLPLGATAIAFGLGDNETRLAAFERVERRVLCPARIHPSAVVGSGVQIGRGTIVMAGAILSADAKIGRAVIVNTAAVVEHDCVAGDGVHVSPGAVLCGGVQVGRLAWIGAGAVITPGVVIGEGAVVGAGSTVIDNVPAGATVAGSPARPVGSGGSS